MNKTQQDMRQMFRYDEITGDLSTCVPEPIHMCPDSNVLVISIKGVKIKMSKVIWLYVTGEWPSGDVLHRDEDPWNMKWSNLYIGEVTIH